MPFYEKGAVRIHYQAAVKPGGVIVSQGAIEQDLAGGGLEQVGAAHHFRYSHSRVVGHAGKLVAGHAVAPPDDKVSKVAAGHKALRAEIPILEVDGFAVGNAESPVDAIRGSDLVRGGAGKSRSDVLEAAAGGGPAGSGINRFVVQRLNFPVALRACRTSLMRRGERGFKILARAAAGVEEAALEQLAPCGKIERPAETLRVRRKDSFLVRTGRAA